MSLLNPSMISLPAPSGLSPELIQTNGELMCQGKTPAVETEADSKGLLVLHQEVQIKRKKSCLTCQHGFCRRLHCFTLKSRVLMCEDKNKFLLLCATLSVLNKQLRLNASMHFQHFTSFLRLLKESWHEGRRGRRKNRMKQHFFPLHCDQYA